MNKENKNIHNQNAKRSLVSTLVSKPAEYIFVFFLGALTYLGIELLWRGYSHITMFFAGGICFAAVYLSEKKYCSLCILYRCVYCAVLITGIEFAFGVVFNIIFGLNVWDYSDMPFNLLGQICPRFFLAWMAISLPAFAICRRIRALFVKIRQQFA